MTNKEYIISVDTPSGFDVDITEETQNVYSKPVFKPSVIISLSVPKPVAHYFVKLYGVKHFLGANIVPVDLQRKYNIELLGKLWEEANNKEFFELDLSK